MTDVLMFERSRDKNGEMCLKHGNTLIRTLRKHKEQRDIPLLIAPPLQRRTGGGLFWDYKVATERGISLTPGTAKCKPKRFILPAFRQ